MITIHWNCADERSC